MVSHVRTTASSPAVAATPNQGRVNAEMFKAIEMLGRKLERAESDRDRLLRRLALIESAATVDEKTGKLYLPVVVDPATNPQLVQRATPKWMMAATLMSSALALLAISLVAFRNPQPALTAQQLAALDALTRPQVARFENRTWKTITPEEDLADAADTIDANGFIKRNADGATLPDDKMLAELEESAKEAEIAAITSEPASEEKPVEVVSVVRQAQEPLDAAVTAIPGEDLEKELAKKEPVVEVAPPKIETAAAAPAPVVTEQAAMPAEDIKPQLSGNGIPRKMQPDTKLPEKLAALEKRAFEGVAEAQHDLATLYASGRMVGQDYKRAAYWFVRAADGGVANAHYNMGVMYQQGLGVKQDMASAIDWYKKAAELGHPEAMYNLGIAYIEGVGMARNIDRGVSYFKRAANAGVAQAAYNLGVLYESGFVGAPDTTRALEWYQMAANEGHDDGEIAVDRLKTQMAAAQGKGDALTAADMIEPAAGDDEGAYGEGDVTLPGDEIVTTGVADPLVREIQSVLISKGYLPGKPTGLLDQQTQDAIRALQKKMGMTVDGVATKSFLEKIRK